jgi:hypothetical protein
MRGGHGFRRVLAPAFACAWLIAVTARAGPGTPGITVMVDGTVQWQADGDTPAKRPADYRRGALRGWRLYGGILAESERAGTRRIAVESASGGTLTIDEPAREHPDLDPVLFADRAGRFRFMMVPQESPAFPHGRGPGDGRGGGGQRGRSGPLALEDVTVVRVTRAQAAGATATSRPGADAFELQVQGKREWLTLDAVAKLVPATRISDVPGDVWPLRELVRAKAGREPMDVTVVGPGGVRYTIDHDEWRGQRGLYLRRNARGLVKFEAVGGGGKQRGGVPDVHRIEVRVR